MVLFFQKLAGTTQPCPLPLGLAPVSGSAVKVPRARYGTPGPAFQKQSSPTGLQDRSALLQITICLVLSCTLACHPPKWEIQKSRTPEKFAPTFRHPESFTLQCIFTFSNKRTCLPLSHLSRCHSSSGNEARSPTGQHC